MIALFGFSVVLLNVFGRYVSCELSNPNPNPNSNPNPNPSP